MEQIPHIPLIERFLIIGLLNTDINNTLQSITQAASPQSLSSFIPKLQRLPLHILEEYKSIHLKETTSQSSYITNILTFCLPSGIDIIDHHNNNNSSSSNQSISLIPFTLLAGETRKHVTSLSFYENYTMNNLQFSIQKCLCLISSYENYNTQRDFLMNLYDIIITSKNPKQRYAYLKDQRHQGRYTVVQESRILEFYISFMLNTLYYSPDNIIDNGDYSSFCVKYCTNNNGRSVFIKYHIESTREISIKDFNVSCVLDQFDVEALINIYISMLMEYKIIIVFEKYEEINEILMSLISLIYPLKWKLLPLITFLKKEMIEMLEAPLAVIMGVHQSFMPVINAKIKERAIANDTIIYDVSRKCFVLIDMHFPQLPIGIMNELRSAICLLFIERKIIISKNCNSIIKETPTNEGTISFNQTEYYCLFTTSKNKNDNNLPSPITYFNYKLISIFYCTFINIIKHINTCLNIGLIHQPLTNKNKIQLHDYFDYNKFKSDPRAINNDSQFLPFMKYFTESMKLTEFLRKYIFKYDKPHKEKYNNVYKFTSLINNKDKQSNTIKDELIKEFKVRMIEAICDYYNFTYVSLDKAASHYLQVFKDLSLSNRQCFKENNTIWPPIEIYKIVSKTFNYKDYIISKDDFNNDELPYQRCFDNLCTILDMNLDINVVRSFEKHNSSQSFKEKEYLEDFIRKFSYKNISNGIGMIGNTNKSISISPVIGKGGNITLGNNNARNDKIVNIDMNNVNKGNETLHRHTSSQSNDHIGTKQSIMSVSKFFCLNGKKKEEAFRMQLISKNKSRNDEDKKEKEKSSKIGNFLQKSTIPLTKSVDKSSLSIISNSPQIYGQSSEINDVSTLAESTTVIHSSLFLPHNNSNPIKSNNNLCVPISKKTGLSANNAPLSNSYQISHIQKLQGDNDDYAIFSDGN